MDLEEIKNSNRISEVVWTCNQFTFGGMDEKMQNRVQLTLIRLLEDLINLQESSCMNLEIVIQYFNNTVGKLEEILEQKPLDDGWIYEYGGLNCLFAEITQTLGFPVKKGEYYWISNFVYGQDFNGDDC